MSETTLLALAIPIISLLSLVIGAWIVARGHNIDTRTTEGAGVDKAELVAKGTELAAQRSELAAQSDQVWTRQNTQIQDMENRLKFVQEQVNALQRTSEAASVESKNIIAGMQATINDMQAKLAAAEANRTTSDNIIAGLKDQITVLEKRVAELTKLLDESRGQTQQAQQQAGASIAPASGTEGSVSITIPGSYVDKDKEEKKP